MNENQKTKKHIDVEVLEALQGLLNTVDSDPTASDKEVMQAIDWGRIRLAVARAQSQFQYKTTITLSESEGNDMVLGFPDGREFRFDSSRANPSGISSMRFYDEEGIEEEVWCIDEVREDPGGVLGAFFGKLCTVLRHSGTAIRQEEN